MGNIKDTGTIHLTRDQMHAQLVTARQCIKVYQETLGKPTPSPFAHQPCPVCGHRNIMPLGSKVNACMRCHAVYSEQVAKHAARIRKRQAETEVQLTDLKHENEQLRCGGLFYRRP